MFGLVFMEGTWLIVTIVLCAIGLILLGFFYDPDDGPLIILEVLIVVALAIFWPLVLLFCATALVLASPVLLGKYGRDLLNKRKKKLEEIKNEMNAIDKITKTRKE